jgi:hypothetical protein
MFGVGGDVVVKAVVPNERTLIEWDDPPCRWSGGSSRVANGLLS